MAVLPDTNLTFTMVRDAIGINELDLKSLRSSETVNIWGLMPPTEDQHFDANHLHSNGAFSVWGKVDSAPWEIGDFRGYNHYNRAYGLNSIGVINEDKPYGTNRSITMTSRYFPTWSTLDTTSVWAKYQVWFNRLGDFQHTTYDAGTLTIITNTTTNEGGGTLMIGTPDSSVNGSLPQNSTVYVWIEKVIEVSANYKWDNNKSPFDVAYTSVTPQGVNLGHGWVVPISTGVPAVAHLVVGSYGSWDGKLNKHFAGELSGFRCTISNDGGLGSACRVDIEFRDGTDTYNDKFVGSYEDYQNAGTEPHTEFITLGGPTAHISVGDTLYGYAKINYGSWQAIGNLVVSDELYSPYV